MSSLSSRAGCAQVCGVSSTRPPGYYSAPNTRDPEQLFLPSPSFLPHSPSAQKAPPTNIHQHTQEQRDDQVYLLDPDECAEQLLTRKGDKQEWGKIVAECVQKTNQTSADCEGEVHGLWANHCTDEQPRQGILAK